MTDFRKFPGVFDDVLDRAALKPQYDRQYWRERKLSQGAEMNEAISRQEEKRTRIGNLIARDGDRIEGCDIVTVDLEAGDYDLAAGKVYVRGDVRAVAAASLTGVTTSGETQIGVRLVETIVDHEDDPDLLGQYEGAASHGEAGSIRVSVTVAWGWSGDGEEGDLYPVYLLRDGYVVDQAPPPELSGVTQQIAAYDYGAHENYIDEGLSVTAVGKVGDDQVFVISEGIGNILGFKRYRKTATRYTETEAPDIEQVDAEPHTLVDDGGSAVIALNHGPVNGIVTAIIEKQVTETIVRGGVVNTADALSFSSVTEIISVVQSPTTYVATTDYVQAGDTVDWSPGGAEPAGGSSYDVTYRYLVAVTPTAVTDTSLTVAGGVDGGSAFITYTFKLPRIDKICLDQTGAFVYLKGISAREHPRVPRTPDTLLALCEVRNDWYGTPAVINNGVRNYPFWMIDRMYNRLIDLLDLASLERLRLEISRREPTAKHEVFVDPFTSDRYRDAGEAQDASVFDGTCQISIDPTFELLSLAAPVMLDYGTETVIEQTLATGCMRVNPYQVFSPVPITLTITPGEDFWEETNEIWLSPITRVFGQASINRRFSLWGDAGDAGQNTAFREPNLRSGDWRVVGTDILTSSSTREATFLRQINVSFEIGNLGEGETVDVLTFDGVDVDPGGLVGDVNGIASGSFTIPANIPTGVKQVYAESGSGSMGTARFEGRGIITDIVRQRVTLVERVPPPPATAPGGADPMFGGSDNPPDPLAQTFALTENRHIAAIEVKFCEIGDRANPVICEIVEVENGIPTTNVIAQTEVDMEAVVAGSWTKFEFALPPFIPARTEVAFVFKTDDGYHALSVASRGDFDAAQQKWVGAQPYTVGVLLSSSNARTWTPHQDTDLTMRVYAALFAPTTKTITIGTVDADDMSDIICAANMIIPTNETTIRFRITPDGEAAQIIENGQNWERSSYFTGEVLIEALLTGASKVSPTLGADTLAILGSMRASGTYVSRVFAMGDPVTQDIRMKTRLPVGSTLTVEVDLGDDGWTTVPFQSAEVIADGSQERQYRLTDWEAPEGGRVKLTLTGTPAARPALADLRAFSI